MKNSIDIAIKVFADEIDSLNNVIPRLDDNFENIVNEFMKCKGKIIVIGIGKSGHIGRKISSTLSSTGTPSYFLHPSEAIHGDLGVITSSDIVLIISNSGETNEIIKLIPSMKKLGVKIISFIGKANSTIGKKSDFVFDISVEKEACPMNLAPTSSSTVSLVVGDALAISLLEKKNFRKEDFALRHPGGILGKKLLLTVDDLMHKKKNIPLVNIDVSTKDLVMEMTSKKLGVVGILDKKNNLIGVVTDGDLRRGIEKYENIFKVSPEKLMITNPKIIEKNILSIDALEMMEKYNITSLFVVENKKSMEPIGIIHIHDILKTGINR
ncbi:MAG: KpsF/GutQ family sugar-phosphate isomerase [Candidatus Marinimicrobia bacterium]|nr:KpsF/GutQ family sugar-phosphate isomerase [Candidatus Neomarinimicrobiota bacterium]